MAGIIKGKKYGYNCIYFTDNQSVVLKYRNVTAPYSLTLKLMNSGYRITAVNVYNAVTRDFVKQFRSSRAIWDYFGK